jgi:hypothetical protein
MIKLLKIIAGLVLSVTILLAFVVQPFSWSAAASGLNREVQLPVAVKNEPVVITKVTIKDLVVQSGRFVHDRTQPMDPVTPFQADDDWIRDMTLYLFNRTNRTITFAQVLFGFPETGDGRSIPQHAFMLQLGRIPASFLPAGRPQPADREPIAFRPHGTLAIHLGEYIDQIRAQAGPALTPEIATQLVVRLSPFFFSDNTEWHASRYYSIDPQIPGKLMHLDKDYFPGDMEAYWPGRPGWQDR